MKNFKHVLLFIVGSAVFSALVFFALLQMDVIHLSSSHRASDTDVEYQVDSTAVPVDTANLLTDDSETESYSDSEDSEIGDYLRFSESGDPLSAADLKKWIGKYQIKFIEDAGERPYDVIFNVSIESNGDTHLVINYQSKETQEIEEGYHIYGRFTKTNSDNTKIEFLPEVISVGEDKGMGTSFFLEEKNGNYYVYNQMARPMKVPETMAIPIIKIQ